MKLFKREMVTNGVIDGKKHELNFEKLSKLVQFENQLKRKNHLQENKLLKIFDLLISHKDLLEGSPYGIDHVNDKYRLIGEVKGQKYVFFKSKYKYIINLAAEIIAKISDALEIGDDILEKLCNRVLAAELVIDDFLSNEEKAKEKLSKKWDQRFEINYSSYITESDINTKILVEF